ncbi:MAG TPA: GMP/IMP nucleotidase [Gammaproteobacteria bacterium]
MASYDLRLPWREIDTVLLDMDGTLLDLAFDNFFWLELVPARYAERTGISFDDARAEVTGRYARFLGRLEWYCVEHWSAELGLDIVELKRRHRHLIGYLPGAEAFLGAMRAAGKRVAVVTNAHPQTIAVKAGATGIDRHVDEILSSHDLSAPKESAAFWESLARHRPFDPDRTLLVEDSLAVLEAARAHGVRHTVAIRRPDSTRPAREISGFASVDAIAQLLEPVHA